MYSHNLKPIYYLTKSKKKYFKIVLTEDFYRDFILITIVCLIQYYIYFNKVYLCYRIHNGSKH